MMKIIADENIPFVTELFSPLGNVVLKPGRTLTAEDVYDADVLLVRSVTKVNAALLSESSVKFVGTCTIGLDHIDTAYLNDEKIAFASAPGCNANAVVQYVVSALASMSLIDTAKWSCEGSPSAVVVGGGNVGSRVYRALAGLGFDCRCVDPFLDVDERDHAMKMTDFRSVFDADIVCVHTPLTLHGPHPTNKMFDESVLSSLRDGVVLLNAGRGEVVDNAALLAQIDEGKNIKAVLDVWDGEPDISRELLRRVTLGSPHIAGYSFEGRVGGSLMIFDALCSHLNIGIDVSSEIRQAVTTAAFGTAQSMQYSSLEDIVLDRYDVASDFEALREVEQQLPTSFDLLRKNYPKRREYSHYKCAGVPPHLKQKVRALGFSVDD